MENFCQGYEANAMEMIPGDMLVLPHTETRTRPPTVIPRDGVRLATQIS